MFNRLLSLLSQVYYIAYFFILSVIIMTEKNVLVTGSAKRIGKAIALHMASNGWNVAIHYNSSEGEARKVLEQIEKFGVKSFLIRADLSDEKQVEDIINKCQEDLGSISCLINNASIFKNDNILVYIK